MTAERTTLAIFSFIAICWILSSQLNPLLSGLFGMTEKIQSFDNIIALLAAIALCITRVTTWKHIKKTPTGAYYSYSAEA